MMTQPKSDDEYGADSIRHTTWFESLCQRPRMWTLNGTPAEIAAFLDGYYYGVQRGQRIELAQWQSFRRWLSERLPLGEPAGWYETWRRAFPDDSTAAEHLAALFSEFEASGGEHRTVDL